MLLIFEKLSRRLQAVCKTDQANSRWCCASTAAALARAAASRGLGWRGLSARPLLLPLFCWLGPACHCCCWLALSRQAGDWECRRLLLPQNSGVTLFSWRTPSDRSSPAAGPAAAACACCWRPRAVRSSDRRPWLCSGLQGLAVVPGKGLVPAGPGSCTDMTSPAALRHRLGRAAGELGVL